VQKPLKILVVRFSSIGDIVLTSPVVRCLKKQLGAEVHFITKSAYICILQNNPHIDKIHTFNFSLQEVIKDIKNEKFDWIIDLHHNFRSSQLKRIGVKSKSFHKLNSKKFIFTKFGINLLPKLHIVDRYLHTISHLGVKNDNLELDYFLSNKDEIDISEIDKSLENGYITFAIGGHHNTKILPSEKIISICKKIDRNIILIGGKEDWERGKLISNSVGKNIFNTCGNFTINQSAYLVKNSEYIITHDTGMMHIAAAYKIKIISVWGNTVPDFGMSPYLPNVENKTIQVENLSCRPCSKIGFQNCPKGHFKCMNLIDENLFIE